MSKGLAIIYDRASTKKQEENYTRFDVKRIGIEIAKRNGFDVEAEPRFEQKSGEELKNRDVIMGILNEISEGRTKDGRKIGAVIVPSFTRLSRDEDIVDGLVIKKACRDNGVVVIDFTGKVYDFSRDNDQDTALLEFWFAARDKRQIVSNTLRGSKERAMQGKYMGGFAPFGYRIVDSGEVNRHGKHLKKRLIDEDEANLVRRICKLYKDESALKIARELNDEGTFFPIKNRKIASRHKSEYRPFDKNDIIRIVRNPLYAGWVRWGTGAFRPRSKYLKDFEPQMHFDPELQIISQAEYDRLQRIRQERRNVPARGAVGFHPFSRILKCASCGQPIVGTMNTDKGNHRPLYLKESYRCETHYTNPKSCPKGQIIATYPVAHAVIGLVVGLIKDRMRLSEALMMAAKQYSNDETTKELIAQTSVRLEETNQAIRRLTHSVAEGILSDEEALATVRELRERKERLTRDLQGFEESKSIKAEILDAIKYINGDMEKTLWGMLEEKPKSLARILRLLFKPHSVVVESYTDFSVKGHVSTLGKRKGRVLTYELQEAFSFLDDANGDRDGGGNENENGKNSEGGYTLVPDQQGMRASRS